MKKQESPHNYKDCSLDFQDEFVHIVQKGQFETDVYYHNINALSYEYVKQTITIEETGLEIKLTTQKDKNYKPLGTFFLVLSVFLLGFAAIVICLLNKPMELYQKLIVENLPLMETPPLVLAGLGAAALGLILFILGLIVLLGKKKKHSFKAGYDELNKRYHEKQMENVKMRKKQLGIPDEAPIRMKSLQAATPSPAPEASKK